MERFDHRTATEEEVLARAALLEGMRVGDIPGARLTARDPPPRPAGGGAPRSRAWFGIPPNPSPGPDFARRRDRAQGGAAGSRPTRVCGSRSGRSSRSIDYDTIAERDLGDGQRPEEAPDPVRLLRAPAGQAQGGVPHPPRPALGAARPGRGRRSDGTGSSCGTRSEPASPTSLSEADGGIMGPCTKGASSRSLRRQPFSDVPAMSRAFALKAVVHVRPLTASTVAGPSAGVSSRETASPPGPSCGASSASWAARSRMPAKSSVSPPSRAKNYAARGGPRGRPRRLAPRRPRGSTSVGPTVRMTRRVGPDLYPYEAMSFPRVPPPRARRGGVGRQHAPRPARAHADRPPCSGRRGGRRRVSASSSGPCTGDRARRSSISSVESGRCSATSSPPAGHTGSRGSRRPRRSTCAPTAAIAHDRDPRAPAAAHSVPQELLAEQVHHSGYAPERIWWVARSEIERAMTLIDRNALRRQFKLMRQRNDFLAHETDEDIFPAWILLTLATADEGEAASAICGGPWDRGVDALLVDKGRSKGRGTVWIVQGKFRQAPDASSKTRGKCVRSARLANFLAHGPEHEQDSDFWRDIAKNTRGLSDRFREASERVRRDGYRVRLIFASLWRFKETSRDEAERIAKSELGDRASPRPPGMDRHREAPRVLRPGHRPCGSGPPPTHPLGRAPTGGCLSREAQVLDARSEWSIDRGASRGRG
ncbi:MAG: hypothetical protein KatS3mg014_0827 [Actinomycetota bacterium]|nr:MAG: hypothetical protein KatS3mg014_0827 [Actinomycetota bacterium]